MEFVAIRMTWVWIMTLFRSLKGSLVLYYLEAGRSFMVMHENKRKSDAFSLYLIRLAQEEKKSEHAWYLEHHMKILGCLDRLETFLEIHKGGYNDEAFASFRDSGISSIAMAYASSGNTEALQVCQQTCVV